MIFHFLSYRNFKLVTILRSLKQFLNSWNQKMFKIGANPFLEIAFYWDKYWHYFIVYFSLNRYYLADFRCIFIGRCK